MEALLEIFLEIFIEIIGELIFVFLGKVFDIVGNSKRALKITKIVIYSTIAISLLVLLTISLIYKKGVIVILVLSYLLTILLGYYLIFIFNNTLDRPKGSMIVRWIIRVLRYVFMISLLVVGNIVLVDSTAKLLITIGSMLGILVYTCIDIYRYLQYKKKEEINNIPDDIL